MKLLKYNGEKKCPYLDNIIIGGMQCARGRMCQWFNRMDRFMKVVVCTHPHEVKK